MEEKEKMELIEEIKDDLDDEINTEILKEADTWEGECCICGTEFVEFQHAGLGSCPICGWEHIVVDKDGYLMTCAETITPEIYWAFGDVGEGDRMCYRCRENFNYHPDGTVVIHPGNGKETFKVIYQGSVGMPMPPYEVEWDELDPSVKVAIEGIITGTEWRNTDAWRGVHETPKEADGWTRALDGWHSTMTKTNASEFINSLEELAEDLNMPIIKVFTTTSNICSTGVDVYVKKDDLKKFKEAAEESSLRTGVDGGIRMSE